MTASRTMPSIVSLLLVAGCSFFSRSQSSFYSLERIPPPRPVVSVRGAPIGIDAVELPPGFDRKEIVALKPDHQLDVRGTQQWSANLGELVLHTLAYDLAGRLAEGMVILPGEAMPTGATRSINIAFEELAAGPDAKVVLDARWIVREAGRPDVTGHERIAVTIASLDSANIASGTSQALAEFADRIAAGLSR
jgi:uncharacterized lipoprotein YmbA